MAAHSRGASTRSAAGSSSYAGPGSASDAAQLEEDLYDARSIARAESAQIMSRKFAEREAMKQFMADEERRKRRKRESARRRQVARSQRKTASSPFVTDLVAENERIDEEITLRQREEAARERALVSQKHKVKSDIVHKALAETSDLEALRREKKAIMMEEKRLKALLDLEKSNAHGKQDLLAAQRAERQRKQAVSDHKRALRREEMLEQQALLGGLLREKLAIKGPKYPGTFSSFGTDE